MSNAIIVAAGIPTHRAAPLAVRLRAGVRVVAVAVVEAAAAAEEVAEVVVAAEVAVVVAVAEVSHNRIDYRSLS